MKTPKYTGVEVRTFDWFGWFGWLMCFIGLFALYWNVVLQNYWVALAVFFCFIEYVVRVGYGRIYKHIYYDTILYPMYEISIDLDLENETYFVCAENEEELDLYVNSQYPNMKYKILRQTYVESYIKTEKFE